jgi:hypothetical protein
VRLNQDRQSEDLGNNWDYTNFGTQAGFQLDGVHVWGK